MAVYFQIYDSTGKKGLPNYKYLRKLLLSNLQIFPLFFCADVFCKLLRSAMISGNHQDVPDMHANIRENFDKQQSIAVKFEGHLSREKYGKFTDNLRNDTKRL